MTEDNTLNAARRVLPDNQATNRVGIRVQSNNQQGTGLVDAIIALAIFALAMVVGVGAFTLRVRGVMLDEQTRTAEAAAENAIEALVIKSRSGLPADAGSFEFGAERTANLTGACRDQTCDKVLLALDATSSAPASPAPTSSAPTSSAPTSSPSASFSPAGGHRWSAPLPANYTVRFIRRWKVEDLDSSTGVRRISLIVTAPPMESDQETTSAEAANILAARETEFDVSKR